MHTIVRSSATRLRSALSVALIAGAVASPAFAADPDANDGLAKTPQRSFEIYGFAEADAIQDTKRVDPNWSDAFRPSKIGVDDQYRLQR